MIDSIKTEAIKDLLTTEFPYHQVHSKLIDGQQYYQIKWSKSTVAILCVTPDYFSDLASADDVCEHVKAKEAITPLKYPNDAVNVVLLGKNRVRMNQRHLSAA